MQRRWYNSQTDTEEEEGGEGVALPSLPRPPPQQASKGERRNELEGRGKWGGGAGFVRHSLAGRIFVLQKGP